MGMGMDLDSSVVELEDGVMGEKGICLVGSLSRGTKGRGIEWEEHVMYMRNSVVVVFFYKNPKKKGAGSTSTSRLRGGEAKRERKGMYSLNCIRIVKS